MFVEVFSHPGSSSLTALLRRRLDFFLLFWRCLKTSHPKGFFGSERWNVIKTKETNQMPSTKTLKTNLRWGMCFGLLFNLSFLGKLIGLSKCEHIVLLEQIIALHLPLTLKCKAVNWQWKWNMLTSLATLLHLQFHRNPPGVGRRGINTIALHPSQRISQTPYWELLFY